MKMLWLVAALFLVASDARSEVTRYMIGSLKDVNPRLYGPAFHMQGGGDDVDAAFQRMIDLTRGCTNCPTKLDVVALRVPR